MKALHKLLLPVIVLSLGVGCNKDNEDDNTPPPDDNWPTVKTRELRADLNFPWEITWGKDDHIWVTERGGRISKIDPRLGNTVFSFTIPEVVATGEGGLLGYVQHPDFLTNGQFFVVYNYTKNGQYTEKVVRYTFSNNAAGSPLTILDDIPAANIHNGSRLLITPGPNPKLIITTGDAANTSLPQTPGSRAGKVLRVNLDGSIPADNPVPGNPYWSLGHRNPQGLVFANNTIYTSEHGPNIEDEVNIIEKGRNYGWPNVNGPCDLSGELSFCNSANVKAPIWSSGNSTVAVCGMDYYNSDRIPTWKNSLLMTTLKDATLYQLKLSADGQSVTSTAQFFRGDWGRLRDICISPAGRIYLCTSNGGGSDRLVEVQGLN